MTHVVERIEVEGFKSIASTDVTLGPVTLLIGANGAGKSNFIQSLELLGQIADGNLQLEVGLGGGAGALVHADAKSSRIKLRLEAARGELVNTYEAVLAPAANDELVFRQEAVEFHDRSTSAEPVKEVLGLGHRESLLAQAGEEASASVAGFTREVLRGCRVFHFQDTTRQAPVKQAGYTSDTEMLHPDARNLAAFLMRLKEASPIAYKDIVRTVRTVAPFFDDFQLSEEAGSGRVRLRWRQVGSETVFPAEAMSDGTLRFVCMATLLLQPAPPRLLVLDEPELGLHPKAIAVTAEMFRAAAARGSQIIAATQSETLLDQFGIDEVVVVERAQGATVLHRPDADRLAVWLEDQYSLGDLWLKNLLGGRPRRETTERT